MEKIINVQHGQRVKVAKIRGPGELHRRLAGKGITVGREIEIGQAFPSRSIVEVRVGRNDLYLYQYEAERVYVNPVSDAAAKTLLGKLMVALNNKETGYPCSRPEPVSEEAK